MRIVVPGEPVGQPRHRCTCVGGKARAYDPGTADGWKGAVELSARLAAKGRTFDGPVMLRIVALMPRPKSHYLRGKVRDSAPAWHTSKPDYDNIAKAITDALTKAGIWADDAQVAIGSVVKRYVGDGQRPCAEISIEELPGTPDPTRKDIP